MFASPVFGESGADYRCAGEQSSCDGSCVYVPCASIPPESLALVLLLMLVSVHIMFQSEPLYVPVKFHDLPSEKLESTNLGTEKSESSLGFHA